MSFKIGDRVQIQPELAGKWLGYTFTVKRILPKNVLLDVSGSTRDLRCPPSALVAFDESSPNPPASKWEPPLVVGTLVRFKNDLHVVLAQTRNGAYRVVKLGGDNNRYFTNVLRSSLEVIEVSELTRVMA